MPTHPEPEQRLLGRRPLLLAPLALALAAALPRWAAASPITGSHGETLTIGHAGGTGVAGRLVDSTGRPMGAVTISVRLAGAGGAFATDDTNAFGEFSMDVRGAAGGVDVEVVAVWSDRTGERHSVSGTCRI